MHTICRIAKPPSTIRPDRRGKANDPLLSLQTNQLIGVCLTQFYGVAILVDRTKNLPYLHLASCHNRRFSAPSHFFRLARKSHADTSADALALPLVAGATGLNLVGKREMKLNICMFAMLAVVAAAATTTRQASGAEMPQVDLTD